VISGGQLKLKNQQIFYTHNYKNKTMKKNQNVLLVHNVKYGSHENMSSGNYTCSMHPEVKSDKPGKCPKCGMELVKQD
jgi:hypothetical protein